MTLISRERGEHEHDAADHGEHVLPPGPVELARAEQLAEKDEAEQRRGAVEDVGRGREALDEHRQAGAAKSRS